MDVRLNAIYSGCTSFCFTTGQSFQFKKFFLGPGYHHSRFVHEELLIYPAEHC